MSFGFSIGDFITAIKLTNKIRKEFDGAPSQFKEISQEAKNLWIALGDVDSCSKRELSSQQADKLKEISKGCLEVLKTLETTLNKYTELQSECDGMRKKAKKMWKRLQWEPDDIRDLRCRMVLNVTLLNAFYAKLSNETSLATKDGVDRLNQLQDNQQRNKDRQKVLHWLTAIDYSPQQNDFFSQQEQGTGQWLLELTAFQEWLESGSTETLFALGIPGAGKTILTSIVVNELVRRYSNDDTIGIAYIYCDYLRTDEQKAIDLLASLLKQLARRQSSLPDSLKKMYNQHQSYQTRPSFNEISTALQSVSILYSTVFIMIDALDQCQASGGCRSKLLKAIFDLQDKSKAKVFATSRNIPEITEKFRRRESLEIEIRASDMDVRKYLDGNMFWLPDFIGHNPELQREIKTRITQSAQGMFLLAPLHLRSLKGVSSLAGVQATLADLPTGSDVDIYNRVYKDAMNFSMLLRLSPMSDFDKDRLPQIEDVLSVCAGLVTVDKESGFIRLVHYTTQQYFEKSQKSWFPHAKPKIAQVCVGYLSFNIFGSGKCLTDVEFEERLQSYPLFDYAARNWGHHVRDISIEEVGETLSWAAESGYEEIVKRLLEIPIEKNWRDQRGRTPLSWAAYNGHDTIVKLLLQKDVDPDPKDNYGQTPLSSAAYQGYEEVVERLLATRLVNPNIKYLTGETPLWWAAYNGHEGVVRQLLAFDSIKPDSMNIENRTPLWAAGSSGNKDILLLLLEKGVNPDPRDECDQSALSVAAEHGHETIVRILLDNFAVDPDFSDEDGKTPLYYASAFGHYNIVEALLDDSRVNRESKDRWGRTPVWPAVANGHVEIINLLLKKGINLDAKDEDGRTLLWWAAAHGQCAVVELFLQQGIDPGTVDDFGFTPLSFAAGKGHEDVVELLLAHNQVSQDSQDKWGGTPLFWATVNGHESVVELLCRKEIQADRAHELDLAPLVKAAIEGNDEDVVVNSLLSKDAVDLLLLVTSQRDRSTLDALLLKYPQWQYAASSLLDL
ncbi:Ankyrin repeat-containing domain protein [Fusarium austroafricanum]|uniref:Ankyrin repeat-containing domain protein n=1 Tax=Fusarium austroafricanum TaxID=2364996 RepID=A0A8H4NUD1_9HYPO|nr:Ankyrin repeat-containing domain protein [Fusarium austroafricanum]